MTNRAASRLAWGWAALTLAIVMCTAVLAVLNRSAIHVVDDANPIEIILPIGFALVGALVASRRPENAIGWIFLGLALVAAVPGIADQYVRRGLLIPRSLPGLAWSVWVSQWSGPIIFPAGL